LQKKEPFEGVLAGQKKRENATFNGKLNGGGGAFTLNKGLNIRGEKAPVPPCKCKRCGRVRGGVKMRKTDGGVKA